MSGTRKKKVIPNSAVKDSNTAKKTVKKKTEKNLTKSAHRISRVTTGIMNFDTLVEGGLVQKSTNLLVGNSGAGKSIFSTQFIVGGMKRGEPGLFITFEEKKKQFYDYMLEFGWNLAEYEKKGLFTFLEYTPVKVRTMLEEGGGAIESIIFSKKIARIVFDSISSFELLFEDELSKREAAISLFGMIRDWNATALLTLEQNPANEEKKSSSKTLEFESDSIITLFYPRENDGRKRYLEVLKMRGTKHSKRVFPTEIGKHGFVVAKKPVSRFP